MEKLDTIVTFTPWYGELKGVSDKVPLQQLIIDHPS